MAFGVVRLTLILTGVFLLYYALYGTLTLLSTNCSVDTKGQPQKNPVQKTKIGISILIAVAAGTVMLYFSHSLGESWEQAEESLADAPFYSHAQWEHSAEAATWAVHSVRYVIAAAVIFPVIIVWMKIQTLGPLGSCKKDQGGFLAQARDALGSIEPAVYIVLVLLTGALFVSVRNWRGYRHADKAAQMPEGDSTKFGDRTVQRIQATKQKFADLHAGIRNVRNELRGGVVQDEVTSYGGDSYHSTGPDIPVTSAQGRMSAVAGQHDSGGGSAPPSHTEAISKLRRGHKDRAVTAPIHAVAPIHHQALHNAQPHVVQSHIIPRTSGRAARAASANARFTTVRSFSK